MTAETREPQVQTLKAAFETEFARRAAERRAHDEAVRRQQEADLAGAAALHAAVGDDGAFLAQHGLTAELRRYTVSLEHADFRIAAYVEGGKVSVTQSDKRSAAAGSAAPRKQEIVEGIDAALQVMARFLADETH